MPKIYLVIDIESVDTENELVSETVDALQDWVWSMLTKGDTYLEDYTARALEGYATAQDLFTAEALPAALGE
jgi:hypothetical protein